MRRHAALAFLSAFLLFLVQPLVAKAILPWFGGAPAVWTTAMLFFQLLLLGGYAYADLTSRLPPRRQAVVHAALLLLSLAFLPIIPSAEWKPSGTEGPVWRILGLLTATVGGPYLLLASTAPLVQEWFRQDEPGSPYPLYAWSNAGSLIALLAYPLVVEPMLAVDGQARVWSGVYVFFGIASGWLALRRRPLPPPAASGAPAAPAAETPLPPGEYLLWFALSACGSGLLLAITNQISLDIAAFPFLWIVPLALYLLTFILCFGGRYHRQMWRIGLIVGLGGMAVLARTAGGAPIWAQAGIALFALFAGCMICHGELARRAPAGARLTRFYLTMAAGGAAGGMLVGLAAPVVFNDFWELPGLLITPYVLMLFTMQRDPSGPVRVGVAGWGALAAVMFLGYVAFGMPAQQEAGITVDRARNFYGVLRVYDDDSTTLIPKRKLKHGRIVHGTQFLDPERRPVPTAYYAEGSGVEVAIRQHPRRKSGLPLRVGAVGLGAGTIAAYSLPGDSMRFYEINPDVVAFANQYFTFLRDSKGQVDVVLGDGRIALEREMDTPRHRHRYDVLVVDAFSGDAIPIHLLTREAMELYWTALKPDGILALHTSNRHLNLARVVMGSARPMRKVAFRVRRGDGAAALSSTWLLVSSNREYLHSVDVGTAATGDVPRDPPVVWTDGFSNLLRVISLDPD